MQASLAAVEAVAVAGEEGLLARAFTDLLLTAACCVSEGEALRLETCVCAGQARVVISTGGKMLSPEALETFFDVGGQRALLKGGGDFGLGAALASRILRLFNGQVVVRNGADKGLVLESSLAIL